ncbi:hypothetical protein D3C72_1662480 [compost metagenome]
MTVAHAGQHMPEQLAIGAARQQRADQRGRPLRQAGGQRPFSAPVRAVAAGAMLRIDPGAERDGIDGEAGRAGVEAGRRSRHQQQRCAGPGGRHQGERTGGQQHAAMASPGQRGGNGQHGKDKGAQAQADLAREAQVDQQGFARHAPCPRPGWLAVAVAGQAKGMP